MRTAALLVRAGQSTRVNIHSGSFGGCRQLERKIEMQNGVVFYFLFVPYTGDSYAAPPAVEHTLIGTNTLFADHVPL